MMKKFRFLFVFLMIAAMSVCLMGCIENEDPSNGETPSPELPKAEITLSQKDITVDMYDMVILTVDVKNSEESVVWTVNDATVASVSDGAVKGIKEGETVVKATVGEAFATCNVVVVKSAELPIIKTEYSEMRLYTGDVYEFEVLTKWKDKAVGDVEYKWVSEESNESISVKKGTQNGIFLISALEEGTVRYVVSATAVGATVYADVNFTVVNPIYDLTFKNFTKTDDGYEYILWRSPNDETTVKAEVAVIRAGKETDKATISWVSDNESVATVDENGNITGKTDGNTVITATVSGEGITEFSVSVNLTVKVEVYHTVTYIDSDKITILNTEKVLDGMSANYGVKTYPEEIDLDDGYKAYYNRCDWVTVGGKDASATLNEVTSDITVYATYGYIAYNTQELLKKNADQNNSAIVEPFGNKNKYAIEKDGKLSLAFRAHEDDTQVALMELTECPLPLEYNPNTLNARCSDYFFFIEPTVIAITRWHSF